MTILSLRAMLRRQNSGNGDKQRMKSVRMLIAAEAYEKFMKVLGECEVVTRGRTMPQIPIPIMTTSVVHINFLKSGLGKIRR